jgi:hypothetical protein
VIPISYLYDRPIDRGRVLEALFSDRVRAWAEAAGADPVPADGWLDTAMSDTWGADLGLPVLMLNATEVGSGQRRILSPLPQMPNGVSGRLRLEDGNDLTVGNAMTISARFPVVTPPARVRIRDSAGRPVVRQLVDGGYFDNSGIESLMEMIGELLLQRRGRPVVVLVFSVDEKAGAIGIKGTVGAPVDAFTSAWRARRDLTARRLREAFVPQVGPSGLNICDVRLFQQTTNFTVSWFLTDETFRDIEIQIDGEVAPRTFRYAKAEPEARDLCVSDTGTSGGG